MSFQIGDVVEIISCGPEAQPPKRALVGAQAVVTGLFEWRGIPSAHTAPDTKNGYGWFHSQLRKINPPDWSAPMSDEIPNKMREQA